MTITATEVKTHFGHYLSLEEKEDIFITKNGRSVADIYHIMRRAYHDDKTTREELKKLFLSFGILDTTALDCRNAISSPISDFEDAILAETAARSGVDCIVTRNARDFAKTDVVIAAPEDFLEEMRN